MLVTLVLGYSCDCFLPLQLLPSHRPPTVKVNKEECRHLHLRSCLIGSSDRVMQKASRVTAQQVRAEQSGQDPVIPAVCVTNTQIVTRYSTSLRRPATITHTNLHTETETPTLTS